MLIPSSRANLPAVSTSMDRSGCSSQTRFSIDRYVGETPILVQNSRHDSVRPREFIALIILSNIVWSGFAMAMTVVAVHGKSTGA